MADALIERLVPKIKALKVGPAADRSCRVTERAGADLVSDCHARRGASGGAVFSAEGPHRYLGIISRGDSDSVSIFVPLARLATQLRPFLEIHQPGAAEPPPR